MSTANFPVLFLARAVLETATPLSISSGNPDGVFDTALVRDANGLPAIPGSSLAGVLRHLWWQTHGPASTDLLFGHQRGKEGQSSRLAVSWGTLLDSTGRAPQGLLLGEQAAQLLRDPLYQHALAQRDAPVLRNRVRLTHRGAAADTGKFDRTVLPSGNRFAIELRLWANDAADTSEWHAILALLAHPGLRLGGATRAGLGRLRCVSLHQGQFDLRQQAGAQALGTLGRDLTDTNALTPHAPAAHLPGWVTGTLRLRTDGLWRIGQGDVPLGQTTDKPADLLPVTEEHVEWRTTGQIASRRALLVPAASLKGALAHRMAFHAHRLAGTWADDRAPQAAGDPPRPSPVRALFGDIKDKQRSDAAQATGWAGCLFIDDVLLPLARQKTAAIMHNAIDRFTGGVRDRMLFQEQSLFGGEVDIPLTLDLARLRQSPGQDSEAAEAGARSALRAALQDLCTGRLALGSRSTSGNGFFRGELSGPLADWLQHADPTPPLEDAR
ncbi:MAG: hypothetical protein B7X31_10050 [Thiomonas sp. 13-66-29]|jgi:CRISPR/Cas system CSM-associated protein Csm3 (group 7 of RAMP superfamily)|nr:MAG: hypothetical protein B7X31_10050 [Thiomonas sp. 13-66-29]